MLPLAVSNGEVIIVVVAIAAPIAAIAFAGSGAVYRQIGKGTFAMDHERKGSQGPDLSTAAGRAEQQAELRQMLEAKAYRQRRRGERPIDVEEEMRRINAPPRGGALAADPGLVDEVRQLVIARNHRRLRQGKEPLDIEAEIARQLEDLEGLGQ
ncbi:MAG: hypothetical protein KDB58_12595 [Solirubrobacterales bacterium]|nr:hypothetical protein [Solirubrobacterales bacterium]MCB8970738.1 hypothetical protein [Thermoleophilales bacterium]